MEDDPLIGYAEISGLAGIKASTLRGYRAQGRLPEPDNTEVSDRPRWRTSTITAWLANRPGRGARTDLRPPDPAT
ncbi:MarR family transcriptional regulator [Parafrankia soli]|uniref:MarR family transcriptional regulator n=1 Tax=Parafrankia soli TaxID=2599596 RepID=A0A1S1PDJ6_9ACTN|nr:MarR family transcriptional regulator [Parafrankia soli]OHV20988.1 MarR family transcriptional regulator [Parafrankia soli]